MLPGVFFEDSRGKNEVTIIGSIVRGIYNS